MSYNQMLRTASKFHANNRVTLREREKMSRRYQSNPSLETAMNELLYCIGPAHLWKQKKIIPLAYTDYYIWETCDKSLQLNICDISAQSQSPFYFHQKPVRLAMMCALICIWTVMWRSCFQNSTPAGSFQSCITPFTVRGFSWPGLIWDRLFILYFHQQS